MATTGGGPLVHIGYHKTATSWLQSFLFDREDLGFVQPFRPTEVTRLLASPHGLDFDASSVCRTVEAAVGRAASSAMVPVLSSEALCGSPHSGGYNTKELAQRVRETVNRARILIVIREQNRMIASTYKHYVRRGGTCTLEQYVRPVADSRIPLFRLEHFAYDKLIGYYMELFGPENVLVLPYEAFSSDPEYFVQSITEFAGVKPMEEVPSEKVVNSGLSYFRVLVRRRTNVVTPLPSSLNPHPIRIPMWSRRMSASFEHADRLLPTSVHAALEARLSNRVQRVVGESFRASNRRTSRLTGLDLADLDYDL